MPSEDDVPKQRANSDSKAEPAVPTSSNARRVGTPWRFALRIIVPLSLAYFISRRTSPTAPSYAVCSSEGSKIYTADVNNTRTQCIVVRGEYIHDVGPKEDILWRWKGSRDLKIHYISPGSIVVPGLSDSHAHILEYGATQQLPLEGAQTVQDAVDRVREHILDNPDVYNDTNKFVIGGGWDHTIWPSSSWPNAAALDADPVIRGRPVVLQSKDCHALWVSSRAIETSLPLPDEVEGGVIVRDAQGRPTGVLLDNAQDLVHQPELTEADLLRRFRVTVRDAHKLGLTSIHDAGLDPASLAFFKRQASLAPLPIRIYGMTYFNENQAYWGNTTTPVQDPLETRLSARSVKIFADGALRTGGAALHAPYHDNPTTKGFMRLDPNILFDVIPKFLRNGWQVNVHAIGDRANAIVLDAFEKSLDGANVTALRPRLEHAQFMTKEDMLRLGRLGVIASVQPAHAISDMWYAEERLGPERVRGLYAFRDIIDSGARITLGSDFPVEGINPLAGFYAAISRKSPDGKSPHGPDGWFPEQRLSREEALRGMTIDPAYASFTEDALGSLEIGKRADFTVLSRDIMVVPDDEILGTTVDATVIDGTVVYGAL